MGKRIEIRLAGEGGQGMILAGIILAEAAAIYEGKQVTQTQSYGPESRGGASRSEVVISDEEIDHPEVLCPDIVLALSQEAYDKFGKSICEGGLLIVDADGVRTPDGFNGVKAPVTRIAQETTGKTITANTVALGVLVGLTQLVSREAIEKAVTARAPRGTEDMNRRALHAGFAAAEQLQAAPSRASA